MQFILDTNILLRLNNDIIQPRYGITYNILYTINNEINQNKIRNSLKYKIIRDFIKNNSVIPIGTPNVNTGDDSIINELQTINSKNYYFVTDDKELQERVRSLGFVVYNRRDFVVIIKSKSIIKMSIIKFLKNYYQSFLLGLIIAISFMFFIIISAIFIYIYPSITKEIWFIRSMIIIIPVGSYFLYLFRTKRRIFYGSTEIVIGILTIIHASFSQNDITDILKILAGFYIIIRGFDNIEKGMISPVIINIWDKIFLLKTNKKLMFNNKFVISIK